MEFGQKCVQVDQRELAFLIQWSERREAVRRVREAGRPKPWTDDPLLLDYRWCNVSRMDDRVSIALLRDWYPVGANPATVLAAACLGRLVNWPESLMAVSLGAHFSLDQLPHARFRLEQRASAGLKVFTGAYVVPGRPGESKIETVVRHAERIAQRGDAILGKTMRATWASLIELDGLGSFLAGQIAADIAHLDAGSAWPDRATWAPLGPGSARGINRLAGRPKQQAISQEQFEQELPALIELLVPRIRGIYEDRRLLAMDFQNCLCEYDKYRRLSLKEGPRPGPLRGPGSSRAGKPPGLLVARRRAGSRVPTAVARSWEEAAQCFACRSLDG